MQLFLPKLDLMAVADEDAAVVEVPVPEKIRLTCWGDSIEVQS